MFVFCFEEVLYYILSKRYQTKRIEEKGDVMNMRSKPSIKTTPFLSPTLSLIYQLLLALVRLDVLKYCDGNLLQ